MNRLLTLVVLGLGLSAFGATPASAQEVVEPAVTAATPLASSLSGLGVGLAVLGAGLGIGRIGGSAVEAMARQPELAGTIQTGMIISAALIEGAALVGFVFCLLVA